MCSHNLVRAGLYKSTFPIYSFGKTSFPFFHLFAFSVCSGCHLFQLCNIYVIIIYISFRNSVNVFSINKNSLRGRLYGDFSARPEISIR